MSKSKTAAKVLSAQEQARANVAAKKKVGVGVTLHTSGAPIKGLLAQPAPKPNHSNMRTIASIGAHPGTGNCVKRWHLYRVGLTLRDCVATAGLTPNDVTFWAKCGYLKLRPATDAEFAAATAAWGRKAAPAAPAAKRVRSAKDRPVKQSAAEQTAPATEQTAEPVTA